MSGKSRPKFGAGSLEAMGRQGLKEIRAAIFPESNIARDAEMGTFGTLTHGEVADQKHDERSAEGRETDRHVSVLDERMNQVRQMSPGEREPAKEEPQHEVE
ncbi:MAG: hypothetical protein KF745_02870 [Phycisphaeraceae bacterium]|nr:hypothetical protein [Phycisphaeraceae bacterium]